MNNTKPTPNQLHVITNRTPGWETKETHEHLEKNRNSDEGSKLVNVSHQQSKDRTTEQRPLWAVGVGVLIYILGLVGIVVIHSLQPINATIDMPFLQVNGCAALLVILLLPIFALLPYMLGVKVPGRAFANSLWGALGRIFSVPSPNPNTNPLGAGEEASNEH